MKRTAIKRKQPKRFWEDARAKLNEEGKCRVCPPREAAGNVWLECAHTIGRDEQDQRIGSHLFLEKPPESAVRMLYVNPNSIVPLCKTHHMAYEARKLDLLPYLKREEEEDAVRAVGIARAYKRTTGGNL